MLEETINQVFVYGTLMRGQLRERSWPCAPREVCRATTRGSLYDLGDYPAMVRGHDLIVGEVWRFELLQMAETLRVLDEIEGYRNEKSDLYRREFVQCELESGRKLSSHSYHYARELGESMRLEPDADGLIRWPRT